jgi:hypothetical protein
MSASIGAAKEDGRMRDFGKSVMTRREFNFMNPNTSQTSTAQDFGIPPNLALINAVRGRGQSHTQE